MTGEPLNANKASHLCQKIVTMKNENEVMEVVHTANMSFHKRLIQTANLRFDRNLLEEIYTSSCNTDTNNFERSIQKCMEEVCTIVEKELTLIKLMFHTYSLSLLALQSQFVNPTACAGNLTRTTCSKMYTKKSGQTEAEVARLRKRFKKSSHLARFSRTIQAYGSKLYKEVCITMKAMYKKRSLALKDCRDFAKFCVARRAVTHGLMPIEFRNTSTEAAEKLRLTAAGGMIVEFYVSNNRTPMYL